MAKEYPNPYKTTDKGYIVLKALLEGKRLTIGSAFYDLNVGVLSARVSELRKLFWPINSHTVPHPLLKDEKIQEYSMDAHFLHWFLSTPGKKHPVNYAPQAGRGKFTTSEETDGISQAH